MSDAQQIDQLNRRIARLENIVRTLSSVGGSGTIITDHGALSGLADDDHTQYHNDARALTWIGPAIAAATDKPTPVDADELALSDSAASNVLKALTWANIKATLKIYFDTLYNLYVHPNHSGDVTSIGDGATTIAADAVTYAKMQNVSATDKVLGRATAGAGDVEEIAMTGAGRALVDDASASAQRTTLGLGTMAVEADTAFLRLLGVAGGQTAYGGTGAGESATIEGTSHATKGPVKLNPSGGETKIGSTGTVATFGDGTSSVGMNFDGSAGAVRDMVWLSAGLARWILRVNSTAEAGSNAGSDLQLFSRNDAGGALATLLTFIRSTSYLGFGVTTPQGKFHIHDGTSGWLESSFASQTFSSRVAVIPNGTGDMLYVCTGTICVRASDGGISTVRVTNLVPGGSFTLYTDGGTNVLLLEGLDTAGANNGAISIRRSAGSLSYIVSLDIHWL